ncbi:hypothetical protein ACLI1A_17690 [Flavobacterium sp. RHBU_3]|uniref:hypothetical protein n=1 Tax=Flavobacterium sp. RHBU_3 TaxID=3391184 RepID=UPI0039853650
MKKIFLIVFFMFFMVGFKKTPIQEGFAEIFKHTCYKDYTVFFGKIEKDTVAFVVQNDILSECRHQSVKRISKQGLVQISSLDLGKGDTLLFVYKTTNANGLRKITVGTGVPGQSDKKYINTYSSFPYLVKSCSSFK